MNLFTTLDNAWAGLIAGRPSVLARWQTAEPALRGAATADELVLRIQRGASADQIETLRAVRCLAERDPVANLVLLRTARPGLLTLWTRYQAAPDDADLASLIVTRSLELLRRPDIRFTGAAVLRLRRELERDARRRRDETSLLDQADRDGTAGRLPSPPVPRPADELIDLITAALAARRLTAAQARLILGYRIADLSDEELGIPTYLTREATRQCRHRAEARLAAFAREVA